MIRFRSNIFGKNGMLVMCASRYITSRDTKYPCILIPFVISCSIISDVKFHYLVKEMSLSIVKTPLPFVNK